MRKTNPPVCRSRRVPLAVAVIALLGLGDVHAVDVTSCTDTGPSDTGNLRNTISGAPNGAFVNLSGLSCSAITLRLGEIIILQKDLTIYGGGQSKIAIQPSGSARTRVFNHAGNGSGTPTLTLEDVTVKFGYANDNSFDGAYGGCIRSVGNVDLIRATVKNCLAFTAKDTTFYYAYARGGGIYARGDLSLYRSTLGYNLAGGYVSYGTASGGGAYVRGGATIYASSISGNSVTMSSPPGSSAARGVYGGLRISGDTRIRNSTVSGNTAAGVGGLGIIAAPNHSPSQVTIINSTISGNSARGGSAGGMFCKSCTAKIYDTTIAFNNATYGGTYWSGGLTMANSTLNLQSSLLSNNTSEGTADDLRAHGALGGSNNLIHATYDYVPSGTLRSCPLLGPLRNNGGQTKTHALLSRSPGIDVGNHSGKDPITNQPPTGDQRGSYWRVSGVEADIGAYEIQQDDVLFNSGFDGCS